MIHTNALVRKLPDTEEHVPTEIGNMSIVQTDQIQNYLTNRGFARTIQFPEPRKRTRLVVQRGLENISMPLNNIALFFTENKIVYAIDQLGKKYITDSNLSVLEQELDDQIFFRANRQYIISINHMKSFRTYERVKLKVDMNPGVLQDQDYIIVSQETAPAFRKWIYAA